MWLIKFIFSSILQTWYVELRISRSISESPLGFEITRVDCIQTDTSLGKFIPIYFFLKTNTEQKWVNRDILDQMWLLCRDITNTICSTYTFLTAPSKMWILDEDIGAGAQHFLQDCMSAQHNGSLTSLRTQSEHALGQANFNNNESNLLML